MITTRAPDGANNNMTARPKQTWRGTWFWDLVSKLEIFIIEHHKSLVQSSVIKIEPEWWLSPMKISHYLQDLHPDHQDHRSRSSLAAPSSIKEVLVVVGISAVLLEDFKTFCIKVLASFYWQPLSTQVITSIILYGWYIAFLGEAGLYICCTFYQICKGLPR